MLYKLAPQKSAYENFLVTAKVVNLTNASLLSAVVLLAATHANGQQPQPTYPTNNAAPGPYEGAAFPPPDPRVPQTTQPAGVESLPQPQASQPPGVMQGSGYGPPPGTVPSPGSLQPPLMAQQPAWTPPVWAPPAQPQPMLVSPFQVPTRFWFRTDLLLWWTKSGPMPSPLATMGSPNDAIPGALGQPGTQVIYGGDSVNFGVVSGLRLESGYWLDANQTFAIEGEYFFLGRQFSGFSAFSDDFGSPLIARPVINAQTGSEGSYVDSVPGNIAGGLDVFNSSQLQGWAINGLWNFVQSDQFSLGGLLGFRYLNLNETLEIQDQLSGASDGSLTFGGQPISAFESLSDLDHFRTTNNFYGGMLGLRMNWTPGRWVINAATKLSLGTTQERAVIQGSTTLYDAFGGTEAVLPGGVLATTANIGNHYRSPFAVAPEASLNIGYRVTPWMTVRVGYSFLYMSNVLRPGNQVSRVVSPNLVPSDTGYGTGGPNQPVFQFHSSSYWAQGMNLGLEFRF